MACAPETGDDLLDRAALACIAELHARLIYEGHGELEIAVALMGAASAIFARTQGVKFLIEMHRRELKRLRAEAEEDLRRRARRWASGNLDRIAAQGKA